MYSYFSMRLAYLKSFRNTFLHFLQAKTISVVFLSPVRAISP